MYIVCWQQQQQNFTSNSLVCFHMPDKVQLNIFFNEKLLFFNKKFIVNFDFDFFPTKFNLLYLFLL